MTKGCNNCETRKDSGSDKDCSGYKYHVCCGSCDKGSLVYDSDKNLYDGGGNGISGEQKGIIKKLGVDASSSSRKRYDKSDLGKLWYGNEILDKNFYGKFQGEFNKGVSFLLNEIITYGL